MYLLPYIFLTVGNSLIFHASFSQGLNDAVERVQSFLTILLGRYRWIESVQNPKALSFSFRKGNISRR
jgi:hypothetical protein